MRISNSKAKTWRRCPKQFNYKYVQKLRAVKKSEGLERGSWMHKLLEAHYNGDDWRVVHKAMSKKFYNLFIEEREELGDLPADCERIMKSYLRRWKKDDERWETIDTEVDEVYTMPNGLEFHFIIDLIVWDKELGGEWIWDHKFLKSFMDSDYMLLDAQLARYFYAGERMGYRDLKGVMFNEVRTKPPAIPDTLKAGGVSKRANIDTDYRTYLMAVEQAGANPSDYTDILRRLKRQPDRFFRRTFMPKDKALTRRTMEDLLQTAGEIQRGERRGHYPRTVDKSCTWGCDFKDLCITEYFGGDTSSLIETNFYTKDEYEKNGDA